MVLHMLAYLTSTTHMYAMYTSRDSEVIVAVGKSAELWWVFSQLVFFLII